MVTVVSNNKDLEKAMDIVPVEDEDEEKEKEENNNEEGSEIDITISGIKDIGNDADDESEEEEIEDEIGYKLHNFFHAFFLLLWTFLTFVLLYFFFIEYEFCKEIRGYPLYVNLSCGAIIGSFSCGFIALPICVVYTVVTKLVLIPDKSKIKQD